MAQFNNDVCNEKHKYIEERFSRLEVDVKDLKNIYDTMNKTILAVSENTNEIKHLRDDFNKLVPKVEKLEEKPVKRYEKIVEYIILSIIGILLLYIAAKLGLKG